MDSVTVRDLRNKGGEVLDRAERGERLVVTRDGRAVAELIERRKRLPRVDPDALRADVDAVIDPSL